MGVTYKSRLAKAERYSVADAYVIKARTLAGTRARLVMCPYCTAENTLVGSVQQKGRRTTHEARLHVDRIELPTGDIRSNEMGASLVIVTCELCKRDVNELAYTNPWAYCIDRASPEQRQRYMPRFVDDDN